MRSRVEFILAILVATIAGAGVANAQGARKPNILGEGLSNNLWTFVPAQNFIKSSSPRSQAIRSRREAASTRLVSTTPRCDYKIRSSVCRRSKASRSRT